MKDFWPISLIGGVYKIISKVLANRSKPDECGYGSIISKTQNAFVMKRQILDAILIANECFDWRSKEFTWDIV